MNRYIIMFAMLLTSLAGVAAEAPQGVKATLSPDGVQHLSMLGGSYFFNPDQVILKVNVPVELTVKKASGFIPHDIVMASPEAGMAFKVELKTEPAVIRFTPTSTGRYPFFCSKKLPFLPSHRDKGMEGVMVVIE